VFASLGMVFGTSWMLAKLPRLSDHVLWLLCTLGLQNAVTVRLVLACSYVNGKGRYHAHGQ
jgi:hypothetical protein